MQRWVFELPFGSLTLMVGIVGFALGAASNLDFMVLVAALGGLAGDLWLLVLRARPRVFGFVFPATLSALYVLSFRSSTARGGRSMPSPTSSASSTIRAG